LNEFPSVNSNFTCNGTRIDTRKFNGTYGTFLDLYIGLCQNKKVKS
jgi:hypothetical protein